MNEKDIYAFAINLLQKNPDKANTPLGKQLMQILESRDYKAGEELGRNLCNSYGVDPSKAVPQGLKLFGIN